MAWEYDPAAVASNPKDQVRLQIGDTNEDDPLLQDEEINFFLLETGQSVLEASIRACSAIIALLAGQLDFKVGPYQESQSGRLDRYRLLYRQLKSQVPGMAIIMRQPTTPSIFHYELFSNESQIDPVEQTEVVR